MSRRVQWALFAVIVVVMAGVGWLAATVVERRQEAAQAPAALRLVQVAPLEADSSVWGTNFPRQYDRFVMTKQDTVRTKYGGSQPFSKLEDDPRLLKLFQGYPFATEYNEERGHAWTIVDVTKTKRNPTAGTCMTCKSANVPQMMQDMGPAQFYASKFSDIAQHAQQPIGCVDCHDSQTMNLRVSRPALREALQRQGKDVDNLTRQELRTLVCAQCHVEYYFKGDGKYLVFPWDKGKSFDQVEQYYDEAGFKDWTHPASNADMIKVQHPDYELFSTGIHAASNVACADCHMPYRREGAVKVTDHWIRSPLTNISNTCLVCHRQSEEELKQRVELIQDKTTSMMLRAEDAIVAAIGDVEAAGNTPGVDEEALRAARRLHRAAQLRWDWVAAENSRGFHSPQEAARALSEAIDLARQAQLTLRPPVVQQ